MQTTYDDGALMTDSASAGTAFACGKKTASGVVGMNRALTERYKSIAQLAHEQGKSVGILSSVSLDHATPASYYASVTSRSQMNNICMQLANSGYEFFGGGGMNTPVGTSGNAWAQLTNNSYTVKNTRADILALTNTPMSKVLCINPWLQDAAAMPYEMDRPASNVSLKEMTEVALACLKNDPDGFFMMVEGGKIDWSCHANDAVATLVDMLDFDAAVGVALAFYHAYPNDTLIVVTGDHETGGMTVGQKEKLEDAFDKSMAETNNNVIAENDYLYGSANGSGGYEPLGVTLTHLLNERASIGWTSYSHTGVPVPVFAVGFDAYRFEGFYDNTDIAWIWRACQRKPTSFRQPSR